MQSTLDPSLIDAYKATNYCVDGAPPFIIKIEQPSQPLAKLYQEEGCNCAAYLTACNPFGENVGDERNAELQRQLASELSRRNLTVLPGIGQDSKGEWPGEPSFLAIGVQLDDAIGLGKAFHQNAIVWCDADAVPQLILLR